jgi:hypothetical protein
MPGQATVAPGPEAEKLVQAITDQIMTSMK